MCLVQRRTWMLDVEPNRGPINFADGTVLIGRSSQHLNSLKIKRDIRIEEILIDSLATSAPPSPEIPNT